MSRFGSKHPGKFRLILVERNNRELQRFDRRRNMIGGKTSLREFGYGFGKHDRADDRLRERFANAATFSS